MRPKGKHERGDVRWDGRSNDGPRRDEQCRQAEEECPADEDRAAQMDGRAHWATRRPQPIDIRHPVPSRKRRRLA